ncbi:hypothetical protein PGB90_005153 [Kerria lacca]
MNSKNKKYVDGKFISDKDIDFTISLRSSDNQQRSKTRDKIAQISSTKTRNVKKKPDSVLEDEIDSILETPKKRLKTNNTSVSSNSIAISTCKHKSSCSEVILKTFQASTKRIKNNTVNLRSHSLDKKIEEDDSDSVSKSSSDELYCLSSETEDSDDGTEKDFEENNLSTISETPKFKISPVCQKITESKLKKTFLNDDFDYTINSDDYFIKKSAKERISKNKLSKISLLSLEETKIDNLLQKNYVKHETEMKVLFSHYENRFPLWLFYLREGFNLLMYGLGSKINLLNSFHSKMLSNYRTVTLYGYFPSLNMKEVLNSFVIGIFKKQKCPANTDAALILINNLLKQNNFPVFLIIHNIDGVAFRRNNCQSILSKLASFPNLHMIATIDHINAPLYVTIYQPYLNEIRFENSFDLDQSDPNFVSLTSLKEIFRPLPPKGKKIFKIIAKHRLDNKHNKHYKGISFNEWYQLARNSFLVSSVTAFRVQLMEYVDHNIIKLNNQDCIPIQVKLDILSAFYEQEFGNNED